MGWQCANNWTAHNEHWPQYARNAEWPNHFKMVSLSDTEVIQRWTDFAAAKRSNDEVTDLDFAVSGELLLSTRYSESGLLSLILILSRLDSMKVWNESASHRIQRKQRDLTLFIDYFLHRQYVFSQSNFIISGHVTNGVQNKIQDSSSRFMKKLTKLIWNLY